MYSNALIPPLADRTLRVIAAIMWCAAATKIYQLMFVDSSITPWRARAMTAIVSIADITLGALLFGKPRWSLFRAVTLAAFALYLGNATSKILGGRTCGCFGTIIRSPFVAASVDATAILAIALSSSAHFPGRKLRRAAYFLSLTLGTVTAVTLALPRPEPSKLTNEGVINGTDKVVVANPDNWAGVQMPLLNHCDIGNELKRGRWWVLLFHSRCNACKALLPDLLDTARDRSLKLALIHTGGSAKDDVSDDPLVPVLVGHLSRERFWSVPVPTLILLENGTVISIANPVTREAIAKSTK